MQIPAKVVDDILRMNSKDAGNVEPMAFYSHDQKNYKKSEDEFFLAFTHLLPWFDDPRLKKLAHEKVEILRFHDYIEEDEKLTKQEKLNKKLWDDKVLPHALKQAEILEVDNRYAENKVDFYRLHGQGKEGYMRKVFGMEKYFSDGLVGKDLSQILGSLYMACISFHDNRRREMREKHISSDIQEMNEAYSNYVYSFHKHTPNYENEIVPKITERYKARSLGQGF